jgi:hypothetical protein
VTGLKNTEILAPGHQIMVLERHLHGQKIRFAPAAGVAQATLWTQARRTASVAAPIMLITGIAGSVLAATSSLQRTVVNEERARIATRSSSCRPVSPASARRRSSRRPQWMELPRWRRSGAPMFSHPTSTALTSSDRGHLVGGQRAAGRRGGSRTREVPTARTLATSSKSAIIVMWRSMVMCA